MLEPKSKENQVDYSELLKPPPGYILERAIGTTYSLDLQALLAVPVAMFYSKPIETDFGENENPLDIFDSISKASKTVTIFCQKGKIKVPRKFNKLLSFTEECVVEITPSSAFSSFHPKCWWLWFKNPKNGEKIIRLAILSRNLTFDRSWDIAFYFEGDVLDEIKRQNKPMLDLLEYLEKESGLNIVKELKNDLMRVDFKNDLGFRTWSFYPIGISKEYLNPLLNNYLHPDVLLMMSPFVDDKSVREIADKASGKSWLFSRKTELRKLKEQTLDHVDNSFCIPDIIVDGEMNDNKIDDIPDFEPEQLDLHAKLYISRKGNTNTWFIGSANLTGPAFGRNIECLIELKTDDYKLSPERIYKELVSTEDEKKLFEEFVSTKVEVDKEEEDIKQAIRRLEYDVINCPFKGMVVPDDSGIYFSYEIEFDAMNLNQSKEFKVYLQPYSIELNADLAKQIKPLQNNKISFDEKIKESHLSKYFIFSINYKGKWKKSFLLKADIDLSLTKRDSKILAEIISSKEKFLQYLYFLLSDSGIVNGDSGPKPNGKANEGVDDNESVWQKYSIPLYEELLKASSQKPKVLKNIDDIIKKLTSNEDTKDRVPPELVELWKIFKQVIQ